ncbi:protein FAM102B, partial [Clonorchis sinensis]
QETKGGKSFYKVGFVSVDLACFTALGNVTSRRRYILEGYNERHKRLDNSLLLVSFSMRQLLGDTCFRPPPENLRNCLIEPPDSDEGDYPSVATTHSENPDSVDCAILDPSLTTVSTLLNSNAMVCPPPTITGSNSVCIDRFLESISSTSPEMFPAVQLSRPTGPAHSTPLTNQLLNITRSTTGADSITTAALLRMVLQGTGDDRLTSGVHHRSPVLSQDQLSGLLTKLLSSQSTTSLPDPIRSILEPYLTRSTEHLDEAPLTPSSQPKSLNLSDTGTQALQEDDDSDTASKMIIVPSCSADPSKQLLSPDVPGRSSSTPTSPDLCSDVGSRAALSDSTVTHRLGTTSSSGSGTPVSVSTTPETTPGSSPFHNPSCEGEVKKPVLSVPPESPASRMDGDAEVNTTIYESFDSSTCHSLPLPPNYSARRREASSANAAGPALAVRSKFPDYFATDSGLLLPSRRRRLRPTAQLVFPDSRLASPYAEVRQSTAVSSAYTSNSDVIPELQHEEHQVHTTHMITRHPTQPMSPRKPCPSTCGDSRSSGYQSHSRQSSLESQQAGSSSALIPVNPISTVVEWPSTSLAEFVVSSTSKTDLVSHSPGSIS